MRVIALEQQQYFHHEFENALRKGGEKKCLIFIEGDQMSKEDNQGC